MARFQAVDVFKLKDISGLLFGQHCMAYGLAAVVGVEVY